MRGRPIYVEQKKMALSPSQIDSKHISSAGPPVPQGWPFTSDDFIFSFAEIRYCKSRSFGKPGYWGFYHKNITGSRSEVRYAQLSLNHTRAEPPGTSNRMMTAQNPGWLVPKKLTPTTCWRSVVRGRCGQGQ